MSSEFQRHVMGTIRISPKVWLEVQLSCKAPGTDPLLEPEDLRLAGEALLFVSTAVSEWRKTWDVIK